MAPTFDAGGKIRIGTPPSALPEWAPDYFLPNQAASLDRHLVALEHPPILVEEAGKKEWCLVEGEEPPPPNFGADGESRRTPRRVVARYPSFFTAIPRWHVPPVVEAVDVAGCRGSSLVFQYPSQSYSASRGPYAGGLGKSAKRLLTL
jgi:hypothetical protein